VPDREPPSFNRDFLVKRLAYRIQELAYGGLSARAEAKLKELIEEEVRRHHCQDLRKIRLAGDDQARAARLEHLGGGPCQIAYTGRNSRG
jgi:Protein of unknown function (DUF2924)